MRLGHRGGRLRHTVRDWLTHRERERPAACGICRQAHRDCDAFAADVLHDTFEALVIASLGHRVEPSLPRIARIVGQEGVEIDAEQGVSRRAEEGARRGIRIGDRPLDRVDREEAVGDAVDGGDDGSPGGARLAPRRSARAALAQALAELFDERSEGTPDVLSVGARELDGRAEPGIEQGGHAALVDLEPVESGGAHFPAMERHAGEAAESAQGLGLAAGGARGGRSHRVAHALLDGQALGDEPRCQRGVRVHIDESSGTGRRCRRASHESRQVAYRDVMECHSNLNRTPGSADSWGHEPTNGTRPHARRLCAA